MFSLFGNGGSHEATHTRQTVHNRPTPHTCGVHTAINKNKKKKKKKKKEEECP